MNRIRTTVTTLAALLALAGCGADDSTAPVPDSPATGAASSSTPSPSPTAEDSAATTASPSAVLSLRESCMAVVDDQQEAVAALRAYVKNPLSPDVDVKDLDRLRSELLAGELSAPTPLRQQLNIQVGVLNSVVQGIQDGNVQSVDIGAFNEAQTSIATLCDEAVR